MKSPKYHIVNANQAVAKIAYKTNEVIPIYPITPASEMSELAEEWSATDKNNVLGNTPSVFQMQSEAGVAGAMHGALQTGSLTTTFTSSQGLLLMLPNMYKIAGQLIPNVIHVATRSIATHALSVFGDHSDVMAVRQSGYAMLASASVQEAQDFALISQAAALRSKIPFLHFFDGFRTSHEVSKIISISDQVIKKMISQDDIDKHRKNGLNPNNPVIRGTSQGPDVFFQSREAINPYYEACPGIVENVMDDFYKLTGRDYKLFEYVGHPEAEHIIISMASSVQTIEKTISHLNAFGNKYGLIKVKLFRPFSTEHIIKLLPENCKSIAVLDRTKEAGSSGEPLYLDVMKCISEAYQKNQIKQFPKIVGGRYGLSSKEFTPSMVNAIFNNLKKEQPKNNFTVGIEDDISFLSLNYSENCDVEEPSFQAIFYQNKNKVNDQSFAATTRLIGKQKSRFVQAYTEINYKKSNTIHRSHLRISDQTVKAPYLIQNADFIACEKYSSFNDFNIISQLKKGGKLLINMDENPKEFWITLSNKFKSQIVEKQIQLYISNFNAFDLDKFKSGKEISKIHACYLALYPQYDNIDNFKKLSKHILKVDTYIECETISVNNAVDDAFSNSLLGLMLKNKGNETPVSLMPIDGTFQTNKSNFNQPNIGKYLPEWIPDLCTQCGACSMACPQSALRIKVYDDNYIDNNIASLKSVDFDLMNYTIQVNPDQCNGCNNCVDACPVNALQMVKTEKVLDKEKANWNKFEKIPEFDRTKINPLQVSQQQLQEPLFKYSSGDEGCGEAPYLKLLSQLFGDRLLIANATGASSIFGGALPTTPWSKNSKGRGPAWANSLFEDNAEFGLGFRMSLNQQEKQARNLLQNLLPLLDFDLVYDILNSSQNSEKEIIEQRERIDILNNHLSNIDSKEAMQLLQISDALVKKSVWTVGGDGWAYDIGFGGIDHVLSSGENINILVLDNEVYDNTGGQTSKATPFGAQAKFSFNGKKKQKKDLGKFAMGYPNVYVASVAMGADREQTLKAFNEAESFDGPSIIIAYCHSTSHGIDMKNPIQYHKAAVESGQWLLYRNDPRKIERGQNAYQIDSKFPSIQIEEYYKMQKRFSKLCNKQNKKSLEKLKNLQELAIERFN